MMECDDLTSPPRTLRGNPNYGQFLEDFIEQTSRQKPKRNQMFKISDHLTIKSLGVTDITIPLSKLQSTVTPTDLINKSSVINKMQKDYQKHDANFEISNYLKKPKKSDTQSQMKESQFIPSEQTKTKPISQTHRKPMTHNQSILAKRYQILDQSRQTYDKIEKFLNGTIIMNKPTIQSISLPVRRNAEFENLTLMEQVMNIKQTTKNRPRTVRGPNSQGDDHSSQQSQIEQRPSSKIIPSRQISRSVKTQDLPQIIKRPSTKKIKRENPLHNLVQKYEDLLLSDYGQLGNDMQQIVDSHRAVRLVKVKKVAQVQRKSLFLNSNSTNLNVRYGTSNPASRSQNMSEMKRDGLKSQQRDGLKSPQRPNTSHLVQDINLLKDNINSQLKQVQRSRRFSEQRYAQAQNKIKKHIASTELIDWFTKYYDDEKTLNYISDVVSREETNRQELFKKTQKYKRQSKLKRKPKYIQA